MPPAGLGLKTLSGSTIDADARPRHLDPPLSSGVTLPKPLPSPRQFQDDPNLLWHRYDGIALLRQCPQFTQSDCPIASLYRLCEFICADESNQVMLETNYFWFRDSWSLCSIPDPCDDNTERYAILASLVESLVYAFNYRLSLGLRRSDTADAQSEICPPWVSKVPALRDLLRLKRDNEFDFESDEFVTSTAADPFSKRNIVANAGNLFSF